MCGVVGVYDLGGNAARLTARGLDKLNHRGELGAGIAGYSDAEGKVKEHKDMGLVANVFREDALFEETFGSCRAAIGHTRYATTDEKRQGKVLNLQPLTGDFHGEQICMSHNGDVQFSNDLRRDIEGRGYHFQTTSDTEIILGLLVTSSERDFTAALRAELPKLKGAFSLTILYKDRVIGVRDGNGIRPLCIGRGENFFIIASENCAFETMGASFVRSVQPGEIVVLDQHGLNDTQIIWHPNPRLKLCIFEFIYFARPDSVLEGQSVYLVRKELGRTVIREHPVDADIIVPVPESGKIYHLGMAEESGLPVEEAIFRDRYHPERTFMMPREVDRRALQRYKFSIVGRAIRKKRVVLSEDSVVRASVIPEMVRMMREQGAREVHVRVGAAPIKHPCYFGVDMATSGELIAASLSIEEIRKYIQANSLGYTSIEGMIKATGLPAEHLSLGCFSGDYPVCPFQQ